MAQRCERCRVLPTPAAPQRGPSDDALASLPVLASVLLVASSRFFKRTTRLRTSCLRGFAYVEMIPGLWLINLGVACALQAPPGRKGLKALRTTSPRTPHAAAAVRKTAARLAFTGLVATATASFAPPALAKGGGRGGGGGSSSYSSTSYRSSKYQRREAERRSYYDDYNNHPEHYNLWTRPLAPLGS